MYAAVYQNRRGKIMLAINNFILIMAVLTVPSSSIYRRWVNMMASSNGNIFRVTGLLWGECTGHWWSPLHRGQWRGNLIFYICIYDQWKYWQWVVGKDILTHRSHWHIYASEKTVAIDLDKTNCLIFFNNTAFGMAMIKDQLNIIPQEFAKIRVPPFIKCSLVSLVRKK